MEGEAQADAEEQAHADVAVARALRGEGKCHQGHHRTNQRVEQLAPPGGGIGGGLLAVALQVVDIHFQAAGRHLVGVDQKHAEQLHAHITWPFGAGQPFGLGALGGNMGARHLFERPSAVAVDAAFVCLPGGFQRGVLVVAVDADAEQAAVGQHFAHVDVVAALPKPQAAAAQAHGLLHGMQA